MTNAAGSITTTARGKFFSGRGIETCRVMVDVDGSVRVWDEVAGHYTACHSLSGAASRRIAREALGHEPAGSQSYYAVVTFGAPRTRIASYYRNEQRAIRAADEAVGTGSCTSARVYECESRRLAETADISEIRRGERIVYHA